MASYSYTNDGNNYLKKLAYGNNDSVQYDYDDKGRVTKQTYEDGDTVTYTYDSSGTLATVTDSASGITSTNCYDLIGRLGAYTEAADGYSAAFRYIYDDENRVNQLREKINGYSRNITYTYDEDDRIETFKKGNGLRTYTYDDFGRVSSMLTEHLGEKMLTTSYTFTAPTSSTTSAQVASMRNVAVDYDVTYSYTYDDNGNILTISYGDYTISYEYDSANQLIRENNEESGYTHTWEYDNAGNILCRKEYAYTTGTLGTPTDTVNYTYGDSDWGDLLTAYDGNTITSDAIGNMISDGTWTYTWEHGRELASMSDGETTWSYTYNADGLRTEKTNGTKTYKYVYFGGQLVHMSVDDQNLYFTHSADGTPMALVYKGDAYYYVTNVQGDVVAILNNDGEVVVQYSYDAWGNILSISGTMADTLGTANPLRYRGYVYDWETGLYYLQSRYYNPEIGRFINADGVTSTGQGFIGNNMFAYCLNNPVNFVDFDGKDAEALFAWWTASAGWLCLADGPALFGEAVYGVGAIILATASLILIDDANSKQEFFDKANATVDTAMATPSFDNDDDDDDYYDDDSNFGGRQKIGKPKGKTPGSNQSQNKQFRDATKGLSPSEQRQIHEEISKEGFGYKEIQKYAKSMQWLRKP